MQEESIWYFFIVLLFLNVCVLVCLSSINRKLNDMIDIFSVTLENLKDNEDGDEDYDSADYWKQ